MIADHLRSTSFLIADGVLPSNEGRGYVLRRIMRRAMRHAFLLGAKDPLMHRLVPTLVREMGGAYPELAAPSRSSSKRCRQGKERFRATLGRGITLLDDATAGLARARCSGETAFRLYDTYGFPLDLTQDAIRAAELAVDVGASTPGDGAPADDGPRELGGLGPPAHGPRLAFVAGTGWARPCSRLRRDATGGRDRSRS